MSRESEVVSADAAAVLERAQSLTGDVVNMATDVANGLHSSLSVSLSLSYLLACLLLRSTTSLPTVQSSVTVSR